MELALKIISLLFFIPCAAILRALSFCVDAACFIIRPALAAFAPISLISEEISFAESLLSDPIEISLFIQD